MPWYMCTIINVTIANNAKQTKSQLPQEFESGVPGLWFTHLLCSYMWRCSMTTRVKLDSIYGMPTIFFFSLRQKANRANAKGIKTKSKGMPTIIIERMMAKLLRAGRQWVSRDRGQAPRHLRSIRANLSVEILEVGSPHFMWSPTPQDPCMTRQINPTTLPKVRHGTCVEN